MSGADEPPRRISESTHIQPRATWTSCADKAACMQLKPLLGLLVNIIIISRFTPAEQTKRLNEDKTEWGLTEGQTDQDSD